MTLLEQGNTIASALPIDQQQLVLLVLRRLLLPRKCDWLLPDARHHNLKSIHTWLLWFLGVFTATYVVSQKSPNRLYSHIRWHRNIPLHPYVTVPRTLQEMCQPAPKYVRYWSHLLANDLSIKVMFYGTAGSPDIHDLPGWKDTFLQWVVHTTVNQGHEVRVYKYTTDHWKRIR